MFTVSVNSFSLTILASYGLLDNSIDAVAAERAREATGELKGHGGCFNTGGEVQQPVALPRVFAGSKPGGRPAWTALPL